MDYLKGYKPIEINKGDFKHVETFSKIEEKDSKVVNEIIELLQDKELDCVVYALRNKKEKKYKSVYVFKTEKDEKKDSTLKFYKSVTTDDVSKEAINEFENIIYDSLREFVSIDERWKKVIWNHDVIEQHIIRIGSINLSAGLFGILFGVLLFVITGEFIWFALGLCIGIASGAIVSKIGEQDVEQNKMKKEQTNKNVKKDRKNTQAKSTGKKSKSK